MPGTHTRSTVPGRRRSIIDQFDTGLQVSRYFSEPGVPRSLDSIAVVVGCDYRTIWQIQQKAMKKVRFRLKDDEEALQLINRIERLTSHKGRK